MNEFEFFCFMKDVLVSASQAGWTHQPEYDRYIDGEMTLCFAKLDRRNVMALDIKFDMNATNVLKSGVAEMSIPDMKKIMHGANVPMLTMDKFFDPTTINRHGEFKPDKYFMKGQDL